MILSVKLTISRLLKYWLISLHATPSPNATMYSMSFYSFILSATLIFVLDDDFILDIA